MTGIKQVHRNIHPKGCLVSTEASLLAYNANREGLLIPLRIQAQASQSFQLCTIGSIANHLTTMFMRTVSIMTMLNASWRLLNSLKFKLSSENFNYLVKDARSVGVPFCIALINILRQMSGLEQANNIIGTGILRIDGSFDESSFENKKKQAALQTNNNGKMFVNSQVCQHLFNLATLMNNSHETLKG